MNCLIQTWIWLLLIKFMIMLPSERQKQLIEIAEYLQAQLVEKGFLNLHFICTHNSRRSKFAQAWSHALAQERHLPVSNSFLTNSITNSIFIIWDSPKPIYTTSKT